MLTKLAPKRLKLVEAVEIDVNLPNYLTSVDGVFPNNGAHSESDLGVQAKGKHKLSSSSQVKGNGVLLGSTNRFALLEDNQLAQDFSEHELDEGQQNSPRKSRAAASVAADLMKVLKQKNQVDRGKKGNKLVVSTLGGLPSAS